jgi:hypothetical protein
MKRKIADSRESITDIGDGIGARDKTRRANKR